MRNDSFTMQVHANRVTYEPFTVENDLETVKIRAKSITERGYYGKVAGRDEFAYSPGPKIDLVTVTQTSHQELQLVQEPEERWKVAGMSWMTTPIGVAD